MSITVVLIAIVMVLLLVGMIACAKKQRTNPRAQPVAIFLLVVVIACGVTILFQTGTIGSGETEKLIQNELRFAKAQAFVLGNTLASKYPGEKILIVTDKNFAQNNRQKELVEGFKAGLNSRGGEVVTDTPEIKLPAGMPEDMMMPLEEMIKAADFDKLIAKYADAKIVVSLIGLPRDADKMALWSKEANKRPKMALLNCDISSMRRGIKGGYIVAAVSYKPGVKFTEDPCPKDPQEAFNQRYIILMPDNVDKVDQKMFAEGSPQSGSKGNR